MSKSTFAWIFLLGVAGLIVFGWLPLLAPRPSFVPGELRSGGEAWMVVFAWWFGGMATIVGGLGWILTALFGKKKP